jgi:alginate O-acetyltransferase complex protein AlgJ
LKEKQTANRSYGDYAIIALFVGTIFSLLVISLPRLAQTKSVFSLDEKRQLSGLPKLKWNYQSIRTFPAGFEKFLNDRFAYRKQLVTALSFIRYNGFGVSSSANVVIGKDGWLYLADSDDYYTMRHSPLYAQSELHEWGRALEARRRWLAKRNIKYVVVVAPSKCTIYPEYIKDAYVPVNRESRCDQLYSELKNHTQIRTVDLRPTLLSCKNTAPWKPIYFKTDTHWNFEGGFFATEKLIDSLRDWFPNLKTIPFSETKLSTTDLQNGDLAGMLGFDGMMTETQPVVVPHGKFSWHLSKDMSTDFNDPALTYKPFATESDDKKLPRAIAFRDSFFQIARFFVSEHFSRVAYYWEFKPFPTDVIEREKPDIVIQEIVERFLVSQNPQNPPEVDATLTEEEYAKALEKDKLAGIRIIPSD